MNNSIYVGIVKDEVTLREIRVIKGAKMMVIGSTLGEVVTVQMSKQTADFDKMEAVAGKFLLKYRLPVHTCYYAWCCNFFPMLLKSIKHRIFEGIWPPAY